MQMTETNSNLFQIKRTVSGFLQYKYRGPQAYIFNGNLSHSFPSFSLHGGPMLLGCLLSQTARREVWA